MRIGCAEAPRYRSRTHVLLIDLAGVAGTVSGLALGGVVTSGGGVDSHSAKFALGGMAIGLIAGAVLTTLVDVDAPIEPATGIALDSRGKATPTFGMSARF